MAATNVSFDQIKTDYINNVREAEENIRELAESIAENGLLQPLTVQKQRVRVDGDRIIEYRLIAGFRRYAAIKHLREGNADAFAKVPVNVIEGSEQDALLANLAENIDRSDLSPLEIAARISELNKLGIDTKKIAKRIGKSVQRIYALVRIHNNATPEIKELLNTGLISTNDAQEVAQLAPTQQTETAQKAQKAQQAASKAVEEVEANEQRTDKKATPAAKKKAASKAAKKAVDEATQKTKMRSKSEVEEALNDIPAKGATKEQELARDILNFVPSQTECPFDKSGKYHAPPKA